MGSLINLHGLTRAPLVKSSAEYCTVDACGFPPRCHQGVEPCWCENLAAPGVTAPLQLTSDEPDLPEIGQFGNQALGVLEGVECGKWTERESCALFDRGN